MEFARERIKARARQRVLDRTFGMLMTTMIYQLLTSVLSTVLNLVAVNPISAITDQFYTVMNQYMSNGTEMGELSVNTLYSPVLSFGRRLLAQPIQQVLLFVFLLFYFYTIVMSFGYSGYALRIFRGEKVGWKSFFDQLWMANKIILMNLIISIVSGVGMMCFIIPGVYFYYRYQMSTYVLLDNPELSLFEAMKVSAQISRGYKWDLLMLDLSFLGWYLLDVVAAQVFFNVGNFIGGNVAGTLLGMAADVAVSVYVLPYIELTRIGYYENMRPQDLKVEESVTKGW